MESLLPSEIARLVYGYLLENKCDAAAQLFLESSEYLNECKLFQKSGHNFNTNIMGLTLVEMVNAYSYAAGLLKSHNENQIKPSLEDITNSLPNVPLSNDSSSNDWSMLMTEPISFMGMVQTLLNHKTLHELISENINKAIGENYKTSKPVTDENKKIIETVLHTIEADPIFDELLYMLGASTGDTTTPEVTYQKNGDPSKVKLDSMKNLSSPQEQDTIKRVEAEANRAVGEILAGNKRSQQEVVETKLIHSNHYLSGIAPYVYAIFYFVVFYTLFLFLF